MAESIEDLIPQTKASVGAIIAKPKMADKLLNKPPFRFLHDTVTAISNATGFAEGLFNESELDSGSISDKPSKIAYLEKIFRFVGICKGQALDVRPAKVVSGLEPEFTNMFLISLAQCATDTSLDNAEAVRMCFDGLEPGAQPPPRRSGGGGDAVPAAESKSASESPAPDYNSGSKGHPTDREPDFKGGSGGGGGGAKGGGDDSMMPMEAKIPAELDQPMVAPERGKSRGGTRGGKPTQATADVGLSGVTGASIAPNLDREIERCDGSEAMTQELLGSLISRPKLTEKLLGKPPFRFLHDIVMEIVRATGFASGLYDETESDSGSIGDKNAKMAFLEKIIKVVGVQLNTLVEAKPAKIVAGRDPQDTNNFLQLLAVAARYAPDSRNAVHTVLEQLGDPRAAEMGGGGGGPPAAAAAAAPSSAAMENGMGPGTEEPIMSSREPPSARAVSRGEEKQAMSEPKDGAAQFASRDVMGEEDGGGGDAKRSTRPTTARRRPPKVKEGAKEVLSKDVAAAGAKKTEGIIRDGEEVEEEEEDIVPDESRLADELNGAADAKSSGASDAAGGADPQSKLVKDIMSRQMEQEAAAAAGQRQDNKESADESKNGSSPNENLNTANQGGGGGIRLGRLRKTGIDKKGGGAGGPAAGGPGGASFGETELEKLRNSIQLLVQQTGPLGTCMDYIQEDISMMTTELYKWEEECRKYEVEYEEAKRRTKEVLHPLKLELTDLEDQIFEASARVSSAKASNAHNDEKIQQILKLSATA